MVHRSVPVDYVKVILTLGAGRPPKSAPTLRGVSDRSRRELILTQRGEDASMIDLRQESDTEIVL